MLGSGVEPGTDYRYVEVGESGQTSLYHTEDDIQAVEQNGRVTQQINDRGRLNLVGGRGKDSDVTVSLNAGQHLVSGYCMTCNNRCRRRRRREILE